MLGREPICRCYHTRLELATALAPGRSEVEITGAYGGKFPRPAIADFLSGQTAPGADIPLAPGDVLHDLEIEPTRGEPRRGDGPTKIAADGGVGSPGGNCDTTGFRLAHPSRRKGWIRLALPESVGVPGRFAVAKQEQLHHPSWDRDALSVGGFLPARRSVVLADPSKSSRREDGKPISARP